MPQRWLVRARLGASPDLRPWQVRSGAPVSLLLGQYGRLTPLLVSEELKSLASPFSSGSGQVEG